MKEWYGIIFFFVGVYINFLWVELEKSGVM